VEKRESFYITTTIPYVNADPHIGFALEIVQADVLARYHRLMGGEVFFNAGTDEHGQKVWESAQKNKEDIQVYVDRYAASVRGLKEQLNLSYDNFIRTTDPAHQAAAQKFWRLCDKSGDIYKKKYKALYCVGCEKFLTKRDLVEGKCPLHPNLEPTELEEENYFFKLSKYQDFLEEYLSRAETIVPAHRLEEARQFVAGGLEDFSISREKEKLPWGVPVPDDDTQTMYVWFDALINYVSTLGWPEDKEGKYKKFWNEGTTIQMAGKDQIRFQSIMWQAMLKSAGLPNTDQFFYHGFVTSGGQRMSKSLGNVISPTDMVERYGTDATRYLLLRHVHPTEDTDVTWERLDEWYNADLANGLGNLVARVMKMSEEYKVITLNYRESYQDIISAAIERYEFGEALNHVWSRIQRVDQKITEEEPFKVINVDSALGKAMIQFYVNELFCTSRWIEPFMPETSEKIATAIKDNRKPETLFPRT